MRAAGLDVPAHLHLTRRSRGGQIERPGRVGPPVHEQLLVIVGLGVNTEPADIAEFTIGKFEPAEAQPVLRGVNLRELLPVHRAESLPLHPGLMGAAWWPQHARHPAAGPLSEVIQPGVEHSDVILLACQFCV